MGFSISAYLLSRGTNCPLFQITFLTMFVEQIPLEDRSNVSLGRIENVSLQPQRTEVVSPLEEKTGSPTVQDHNKVSTEH